MISLATVRPPTPESNTPTGAFLSLMTSYLSNARSMRRSTSSGFEIPAASQSIGYILMAVKPGMVLISLKITSPSLVTKKSTRDRP